jgi:hypothetical protein
MLRQCLSNKQIFNDKYWTEKSLLYFTELPKSYCLDIIAMEGYKKIISINDYICINDFYSKLAERNSYINSCIENKHLIDDTALLKINKKCLELAEDALTKIDWSIYKN